MNVLYDKLINIKNAFKGIKDSLYTVWGIDYSGKAVSQYADIPGDIRDKIWDGFFREGRTDFSYAFVNSGYGSIVPPKEITADKISYMLMNCTKLVDGSDIKVNITSDKPTCLSVCMGCLLMTKPPVIRFTGANAHVVRSYVCAYTNCTKLTEASIWFGDGTQSPTGERTDMANCFMNCSELQNLTFSGKGSPKSLDLSACTKLTVQSMLSLLDALMDVSSAAAGKYEIVINSEINALLTEENKAEFAALGWQLAVDSLTT